MASKGQKFKKTPLEKRQEIVKLKIEEGKSYDYLVEKYDISQGTIKGWVRRYKREGQLIMRKRGRKPMGNNIDYKERYEILKKYQDYLREVDREKK